MCNALGLCSATGVSSALEDIISVLGDIQFLGLTSLHWGISRFVLGISSVHWGDIMSVLGDIMIVWGYNQCSGGVPQQ